MKRGRTLQRTSSLSRCVRAHAGTSAGEATVADYATTLNADKKGQLQGLKQLRALELMLKSLVTNAWPDALRLSNHLKTPIWRADCVRRWLKIGDRNDVLSGMLFSGSCY